MPASEFRSAFSLYISHPDLCRARTRELPEHIPFIVTQEYVVSIIGAWHKPAETLFRDIHNILIKYMKKLVSQHFAQYPLLMSRVTYVRELVLEETRAREEVAHLLAVEGVVPGLLLGPGKRLDVRLLDHRHPPQVAGS